MTTEKNPVKPGDPILFADSASGIYIPKRFADEIYRDLVTGVEQADWDVLSNGPDSEWYWETWEDVLNNAKVTDAISKVTYFLHQDGDLWLLPEGYDGPLLEDA